MATFDGSNATGPIRFDLFNAADLISGNAITTTAATFSNGDTTSFTTFSGSNFKYSNDLFTAGTINRIDSVDGLVTQFTLDGLAMPVAQFRAFVNAGNSQGFLAAALAGNDTVTGSILADYLQGFAGNDFIAGDNTPGGGNDTLDGGAGADTMFGNEGNDVYIVDNAKDFVQGESGIGGTDTIQSTIGYVLGQNLEHLFLTGKGSLNGTGNDLANQIVSSVGANKLLGLDANDYLDGNAGKDTLDGGAGDDTMLGGAGNDVYFVDSTSDQVTESIAGKAGGIDLVFSTAGIKLGANIENLTLGGSAGINAFGNELNNIITASNSNPAFNNLDGGGGNDTIIGGAGIDEMRGGIGVDWMIGGAGHDLYFVDTVDKVTESLGGSSGGTDAVVYTGSGGYVLGKNLENLVLGVGATAISATGNQLDNEVVGNELANILDGKAGADSMFGRVGDDTYVVDNALDIVDEFSNPSDGIDTVRSSINFNLADNGTAVKGDFENLVLLGTAVVGTGTGLDNKITGNAGKNFLSGLGGNDTLDGGAGSDTLTGGDGNDVYVVDNKLDAVKETGLDSGDQIISSKISLDISTAALASIEIIELSGKMALNATGNDMNNAIVGNSGANKLFGLAGQDLVNGGDGSDTLDGGAGVDTLSGGSGNDTYIVDFFAGAPLSDIADETGGSGIDTVISITGFFALTTGSLGAVENLTLASGTGDATGIGNTFANVVTGNEGNNLLAGISGNDTLIGGGGNDTLIGGVDDDVVDVSAGNDVVSIERKLDGHDLITGFDGNPIGGQDVIDLSLLMVDLGIASIDRPAHVLIVDKGSTVDIRIDADKNLLNGYELTVATIQTTDAVSVGQDVLLG